MNHYVIAGILAVPPFTQLSAQGESLDIGNLLASYGIAAPFAALCWWQMKRSQEKLDDAEKRITELQEAAVTRERDFSARLGPLLYDGALLYQKGNERLREGLQPEQLHRPVVESVEQLSRPVLEQVEQLSHKVSELIERMEQG